MFGQPGAREEERQRDEYQQDGHGDEEGLAPEPPLVPPWADGTDSEHDVSRPQNRDGELKQMNGMVQ